MRIAIISDIHANLEALLALPSDYDELWVLGDLVNYGPSPAEVIDFVRSHASAVVRGNHDHAIGFETDPRCSQPFKAMAEATQIYTSRVLRDDHKSYLRDLPVSVTRNAGETTFRLVHSVPSDPLFGYHPPDDSAWAAEVNAFGEDILLVGHTHVQFTLEFGRQRVTNPGSLGQSKMGGSEARYALWTDGVMDLRCYTYPIESTLEKIALLDIPPSVRKQLTSVLIEGGLPKSQSSRR